MTIAFEHPGGIRLHTFRTDPSPGRVAWLERLLSPTELERAGRFQFEADRARFVASHGILRTILAGYLNTAPRDLAFATGGFGKPTLPGSAVRFSLSRAGDLCVLAVSTGVDVGVDIEVVRPLDDALSIAKSRFTPAEVSAIDGDETFFALWTRKEAVAKCLGWGLSVPLDVFEVPTPANPDPARVVVDYQGERSVLWLQPVPLGEEGFVCAIAATGERPLALVIEPCHPERQQGIPRWRSG